MSIFRPLLPRMMGNSMDFLKRIELDSRSTAKVLLTSRRDEQAWLSGIPYHVPMPRMRRSDAARLAQKYSSVAFRSAKAAHPGSGAEQPQSDSAGDTQAENATFAPRKPRATFAERKATIGGRDSWGASRKAEAIAPIQNKIGQ